MSHTCPTCGYPSLDEPARSSTGAGSYEICPSCGYQFGVTDDDRGISPEEWRHDWRQRGMPWSSTTAPPTDWDPEAQLGEADG